MMIQQWTWLWTDLCLGLLVILALILALIAAREKTLRQKWQSIFQKPLVIVSFVIILIFILIAVIDSIHFIDHQHNLRSLLDKWLYPIYLNQQITYSKPFAIAIKHFPTSYSVIGFILYSLLINLFFHVCLFACCLSIRMINISASFLCGVKYFLQSQSWRWFLVSSFVLTSILFICIELSAYYHILGTDKVGNDVFYQAIKSIRTGIIIGTVTTLTMLPFAVVLGIAAGFYLGWIDDVIQYIYTTLSSIPGILLIAAAILSLQMLIARHPNWFPTLEAAADARLFALCVILGITSWTSLCRLLRGETIKLRELDYVLASRALGTCEWKIMWQHILPNVFHIILIAVVLDFSALVLAEAVLSYVGVGVDPITPSWGNIINSARLELAREPIVWWPLFAAFIFMFVLVLAANLFADAVREAFDPRIRTAHEK